jgi:hypothetical protein
VYGLAFAYMELGDIEPAQKHFQEVLEMEAPEKLLSLTRNELREYTYMRLCLMQILIWLRIAV